MSGASPRDVKISRGKRRAETADAIDDHDISLKPNPGMMTS